MSARDCARARRTMAALVDGPLAPSRAAELARHVLACGSCRAEREDLLRVRAALEAAPPLRFPDDALREVLARTAGDRTRRGPATARTRRFAAAASVALAALGAGWVALRPAPGPSPAEIDRAAADVRLALGLTAHALARGEAAAERAIEQSVTPVFARAPVLRALAEPAARGGRPTPEQENRP
ncbi:MAG: zf-HC2 domain-containing protein [Acidobacteria bacterium]|nr:zf-HC2 domain-containing protein [Acidobacteriota bacterium]